MSTKSSIVYIDKDGSHIYWESQMRGNKYDGIVGVVDLAHVLEIFNDLAANNIYIKFDGLMSGYFRKNTLHLWHSDLSDFEVDNQDLIFEIKEDSSLSEYFCTQLIKK